MEDWLFNLEAKDWLEKNWFADELTRRPTNAEQLARLEEIHWALEIIEKLGSAAYRLNPDVSELAKVIHLADELIEQSLYSDNALHTSALLYIIAQLAGLHYMWASIGSSLFLIAVRTNLFDLTFDETRPSGWHYTARELPDALIVEAAQTTSKEWEHRRDALPIVSRSVATEPGYSTISHALGAASAHLSSFVTFH